MTAIKQADKRAADRLLTAAVKRAVAMTHQGQPRPAVAAMLLTAGTAASLLLDERAS